MRALATTRLGNGVLWMNLRTSLVAMGTAGVVVLMYIVSQSAQCEMVNAICKEVGEGEAFRPGQSDPTGSEESCDGRVGQSQRCIILKLGHWFGNSGLRYNGQA